MTSSLEIAIPSTTLSQELSTKPFTLYNISLRLPLRTFIIQKRYSEFVALHKALTAVVSSAPPARLPVKLWFNSTVSSPALTEARRHELENYLRVIAEGSDNRWRDTSVWRKFLNLPSQFSGSGVQGDLIAASQRSSQAGQLIADPTVWLDVHREMKGQLHDARLFLGQRDGATTPRAQYEAGTSAKKCLVKVNSLIANLEEGLATMVEAEDRNTETIIGAGELRRRKDLLGSAKVEREGLEKLAVSLAVKSQLVGEQGDTGISATRDKNILFGASTSKTSGRILGIPSSETEITKELDNEGVLMLQKRMMQEQDNGVEQLAKIVRRQKEMGLAMHNELEAQNEMLKRVDGDIDRVEKKIGVAKKWAGKIR
ncbi:unnamed protein product [Blumeria hordei]|uniref:Uncharacterized protein n=2 Tax=Blumeria hordei TaxID=2867405 RepID=A0A383UMQ0_BLUHO|nr:Vam7 Qc SNARE protein [Blumeria hordei DH14]SZF01581.1 unnamed protein product [Blumeria hordei]